MVLLSMMLCVNAQNSDTVLPEGHRSDASISPKQLPPVIQELIENMVYVEGGTFTMGDNSVYDGHLLGRGNPEHQVTLSPYFICRYEVTQEVWDAVMGNNYSRIKGVKLPVSNVCWDECQEFILRLIVMTGINFRLPTEAEWEFAARGGNMSHQTKYSGSNHIDSVAWYAYNSAEKLHPVGQKLPNELGLYDMSGNVGEWCSDFYGPYDSSAQTNPQGASSSSEKVIRGGTIEEIAEICQVTQRFSKVPVLKKNSIGFRLAATPE